MSGRTIALWVLLAACHGSLGGKGMPGHDVPDAGGGVDAGEPPLDASARDAEPEPTDSAVPEPDAGPGIFHMEDSLRGGSAAGNPVGGSFGADGWTTTDRTDRIWYVLPRLVEGSIELTMSNVTNDTLQPSDNEVLTLYEGGWGMQEPLRYNPEYRNNHYKCMIRIYGPLDDDRIGQQKMMWGMCPSGAPGYDECGCASFFEEPYGGDPNWDGTPQRLRIEWAGGVSRFLRNGVEAVSVDWSASGLRFAPQELHFTIGSPRAPDVGDTGMPIGAVFSDLVIEGVEGDEATCP